TSCALQNLENPGLPWYWQAFILKEKKTLDVRVRVSLESYGKPLTEYLGNLEKLRVDLYYKYYGRALLANRRQVVEIPLGDLCSEGKYPPPPPVAAMVQKEKRQDSRAITIKTHLLRAGDDLAEVIRRYSGGELRLGDIVAVAESVVAIVQGRAFYVEDIHPSILARKFSRLFDKDSSLSSPYALEMAIREVGTARIILAFLLGGLGKIFGRKGDFYRLAGRAVATIDDCTGTIPPFDKYVVLGPAGGQDVVRKLKESLGVDAAIVDANDLGKVDILASTAPEKASLLTEVLAKNPQGNAEEQTPIVIVREKP
ncbi:MAG: coenzyme F420-0:L-glutamate ligase, partial [Desulfobacterales bacterium]|nr:coenzyme F420-0:L-glutamate ligase [Desulfobacterales bacterium]